MWMLKLKGGLQVTEKELGFWDRIPEDVEISSLALAIPRSSTPKPFILHFEGYDQICCAKMAMAALGAATMVGHRIYCVKGDYVNELTVTAEGIKTKNYPIGELTLKSSALRRMVS